MTAFIPHIQPMTKLQRFWFPNTHQNCLLPSRSTAITTLSPPSHIIYHMVFCRIFSLISHMFWHPGNIVTQQPDLTSSDCISKHKAQYVSSLMTSLSSCLLQLSWNPEPQNGLQGPAWSSFPQSHLRTHLPFSLCIILNDFQKNAKYFLIFSLIYLEKKNFIFGKKNSQVLAELLFHYRGFHRLSNVGSLAQFHYCFMT